MLIQVSILVVLDYDLEPLLKDSFAKGGFLVSILVVLDYDLEHQQEPSCFWV